MGASAGVFVLTDKTSLVPMQIANFASEDDFQDLLARFPALLAGDQIDAANPRRFVLIDREYPIGSEAGETARWSLDHLFLDQDAVPTLVEVKRSTDTRIRREVVGQMMDYAANALSYWPAEQLRDRFVERCKKSDQSPQEAIAGDLGEDVEWETYWASVKTNLQAGRVRLIFVADRIPLELRKIVEFLNTQMQPAEVLAIELRQYAGGDLKTLAPIVLGQTQGALTQKAAGGSKPKRKWDEAQFLASFSDREDADVSVTAKSIFKWIKVHADRWVFNDAPTWGAVSAEFNVGEKHVQLFKLWTDGTLQVMFSNLAGVAAFAQHEDRAELTRQIAELTGVQFKTEAIDKSPWFKLSALNDERQKKLMTLFEEVARRVKAAQASAEAFDANETVAELT